MVRIMTQQISMVAMFGMDWRGNSRGKSTDSSLQAKGQFRQKILVAGTIVLRQTCFKVLV